MQHVEADHVNFPYRVGERTLEHLIGKIVDQVLGDTNMPDLALALLLDECRRDARDGVIVGARLDAVQVEYIDKIGAHEAQRVVEAFDDALRRNQGAAAADLRLGRDDEFIAGYRFERLADDAFGAIARRGIDEINAKTIGLLDQPRRFILGLAARRPSREKPPVPRPATETLRPVLPRVVVCMGLPFGRPVCGGR